MHGLIFFSIFFARKLFWLHIHHTVFRVDDKKNDYLKTNRRSHSHLYNSVAAAMEFPYPIGLCVQRNRPVARVYGITVDHNLVIVMAPDRVFNGMSEFLDHMMQQRPRTRNARRTLQQQLHVLCNTQQSMRILPYNAVQSWLPDKAVVHTTAWFRSTPYTGVDLPIGWTPSPTSIIHIPFPMIVPEQMGEEMVNEDAQHGIFSDDDSDEEPTEIDYPEEENIVEDDSDEEMPPLETNLMPLLFQDLMPRLDRHARGPPRRQVAQCSICLETEFDGGNELVDALCGEHCHKTCRRCLSYHFANFSNHPVSVNTPFMCCPAEGCQAPYADEVQATIKAAMKPATVERLEAHIQECVQRANPRVPCPKCHATIQVSAAALKDRAPGTLGMVCTECNHAFCFHCLEPVSRREAQRMAHQPHLVLPLCRKCVDRPLYPAPGKFNRYFRRLRPAKEGEFVLLRNAELIVDDVVTQLEHFCTGDTMHVPCMKCGCELHRSSACNELCHCGMVRCDVCGMSGLDYDSHLIDHWGSGLMRTCPRWGAGSPEEFWQHTVVTQHRCKEGVCHNDDHDCCLKEHEDFRRQVTGVRRLRRLNASMLSLPNPMRHAVANRIAENKGEAAKWLARLSLAFRHGQLV